MTSTTMMTTTTMTNNNGGGDNNNNNNNNKDKTGVVLFDSLPYVETIHEDYEEYALALIEEEMKVIEPRPIKKVPPVKFRTRLMEVEYSNVKMMEQQRNDPNHNNSNGEQQEGIMVATIQRKEHTSFQPAKIARPTTVEEWTGHAIPEIKKRYEAERIRSLGLEAEREDGVDSWKTHISALDNLKAQWVRLLKDRSDAVEEINFNRQRSQQEYYGPELDQLNQQYQEVLYRKNQLEHAIEASKRSNHYRQVQEETGQDDNNRKRKAG